MIDYARFEATLVGLQENGLPVACPRLEVYWNEGEEPDFMLQHDDEGLADPDCETDLSPNFHDIKPPKGARRYRTPVSSRYAGIHADTGIMLIEAHVLHWFLEECRKRDIRVYYRDRGCGLVQRHAFTLEVEARALGGGELIADAVLASIMMLTTQGIWS